MGGQERGVTRKEERGGDIDSTDVVESIELAEIDICYTLEYFQILLDAVESPQPPRHLPRTI